mgnify:FL=1
MTDTPLPNVPIIRFDLMGNIRAVDKIGRNCDYDLWFSNFYSFHFVQEGSSKNMSDFAFIPSVPRHSKNFHSVGKCILQIPTSYAFSVCAQAHSDVNGFLPSRFYMPLSPSVSTPGPFLWGSEAYTAEREHDFVFFPDPIFFVESESSHQSGDAMCKMEDVVKYALKACLVQIGKIPLFIMVDGFSIPAPTVIQFNGGIYRFDNVKIDSIQTPCIFGHFVSLSEHVYVPPVVAHVATVLSELALAQYILLPPIDPFQIRVARIPMLIQWKKSSETKLPDLKKLF